MHVYAVRMKLPRNPGKKVSKFRREILEQCIKNRVDCVVEYLSGRIILFSSSDLTCLAKRVKGVLSVHPVKIFENYDALLKESLLQLSGFQSFAVRANKKNLEEKLGGDIHNLTGIPVDLNNPQRVVRVETRGKFFILYI